MPPTCRTQLAYLTALLLVSSTGWCASRRPPPQHAPPFTFASVKRIAQRRAAYPYQVRSTPLPRALAALTYTQYRQIRFKPSAALRWNRSPFEVEFFHRGFAFTRRVRIYEVLPSGVREVRYSPSMFDFNSKLPRIRSSANLGFAGFSLDYPLNTPARQDPVVAFLGASYFRALGRNQIYGATARGLTIDSVTSAGEEYPYFTDFWLTRPKAHQRTMTIYALLDSPSLTGAYRFDVDVGTITQVTVTAELFPRRHIEKLGIAPLTSMFLYGVNAARRRFENWRPQVHDSDGLMMQTGNGEWLWRPLQNPTRLEVNRFMDDNPRGFGLIQRDRDFADYQDPTARYEQRPSYWIQPLGEWGRGGIELVEIPSSDDFNYNIDAYWVPSAPVMAHNPVSFSYVLSAYLHSGGRWPPGGMVVATRFSPVANGTHGASDMRRALIDFNGGDLESLQPSQPVRAMITARGARVSDVSVQRVPENGVWRVTFEFRPTGSGSVDMRCYLELNGAALTETWTDQWRPSGT